MNNLPDIEFAKKMGWVKERCDASGAQEEIVDPYRKLLRERTRMSMRRLRAERRGENLDRFPPRKRTYRRHRCSMCDQLWAKDALIHGLCNECRQLEF